MLRLKRGERAVLVDKVPDIANVGAGALVFGQFLSDRVFSPGLALIGIALWLFLLGCAVLIARGDTA